MKDDKYAVLYKKDAKEVWDIWTAEVPTIEKALEIAEQYILSSYPKAEVCVVEKKRLVKNQAVVLDFK